MAGKRVLITGASGFVGTRLAERLVLGEGISVTAFVHRLSSPGVARLARLPIKMVLGDLLDVGSLSAAIEDCEVIIHLAYGNSGDSIKQKATTILGTENVLKMALDKHIKKVIHLSTAAVHGLNPKQRLVNESAAFEKSENVYRDSKREAEEIVWKYIHHYKLPIVILRPPLIYGPYGLNFTVRIVNEIKNGAILVNGGSGVANLVYVDNLINAIILAMEKASGDGEAFFVVDDEYPTWKEVYEAYSKMIVFYPSMKNMSVKEIESLRKEERTGSGAKEWFVEPLLLIPEAARTCLHSPEFIHKAMQIPWLRFLKRVVPDGILKRMKSQGGKDISSSGGANTAVFRLPEKDSVELYASQARFSNEKIKKILGYQQCIPFDKAMNLIGHWVRYQRLVS